MLKKFMKQMATNTEPKTIEKLLKSVKTLFDSHINTVKEDACHLRPNLDYEFLKNVFLAEYLVCPAISDVLPKYTSFTDLEAHFKIDLSSTSLKILN
jgi:hypothetical protein